MEMINKLDDKYLVLKNNDIKNRLTEYGKRQFAQLVNDINTDRKVDGKHPKKYVVLNMDDELNLPYLLHILEHRNGEIKTPYIAVKDIAVDLVNAILIAGNP